MFTLRQMQPYFSKTNAFLKVRHFVSCLQLVLQCFIIILNRINCNAHLVHGVTGDNDDARKHLNNAGFFLTIAVIIK